MKSNLYEVEGKWIPAYYEEDRPATMMDHIEMLKDAGFKTVEVFTKKFIEYFHHIETLIEKIGNIAIDVRNNVRYNKKE